MSANLVDLSLVFQRRLERQLAGFGLVHPNHAVRAHHSVKEIMVDELCRCWLQHLINIECDLIKLGDDERVHICYKLASNWNDGAYLTKLIDGMNRLYLDYDPVSIGQGELIWSHNSVEYIGEDLANRIKEQNVFRSGLQEVTRFTVNYIERNYD